MEKIKLPRSSYEELKKIITAYGTFNKPANLDDIVQTSGVNKTSVSANNAFLSFVEVIEGGNKKNATIVGVKLARALAHDIKPEIESAWKEIINANDFLTKMLQAVKIRKGMDASQLENHIAFSSGEDKTIPVMTGARAVIDLFIDSGLLKPDGEKLVVDSINTVIFTDPKDNNTVGEEDNYASDISLIQLTNKKMPGVALNIQLTISATPDELEGLADKLKSFLDELKDTD